MMDEGGMVMEMLMSIADSPVNILIFGMVQLTYGLIKLLIKKNMKIL